MNLPNKLTILRVGLVPVCLVLVAVDQLILAAAVFGLACLTDLLDGRIARRDHLVTNFGKFADPIADKVLTVTMMVLMAWKGLLPVWMPIIVIVRELMVDGLRLIAVEKGQVVAADWSGKVKTVAQMITIILALLNLPRTMVWVLSGIVCALTLYSGGSYFWKLRGPFPKDLGI